jgi:hypothetical protein
MATDDALLFLTGLPARRNLQQLREALATVTPGVVARAAFKSERYGVFVVEGLVRQGIGGDLGIGGHFLGSVARVDGDLIGLSVDAAERENLTPDRHVAPGELAHGDIASVYMRHDVHGLIVLTGSVTESDHDRFRLIGSWIVTDGNGFAPRVEAVEVHATRADNILAAPARRRHQDAPAPVEA